MIRACSSLPSSPRGMDVHSIDHTAVFLHVICLHAYRLFNRSVNMQGQHPPPSTVMASSIQHLIELTRIKFFVGNMICFWPYAWGLTMAARFIPLPVDLFLAKLGFGFASACIIRRYIFCAGCIWDDVMDRDLDAQVERTKTRPMASRAISVMSALIFLGAHIGVLLWLVWGINQLALQVLIAVIPLTLAYPLMKRITYWPQAWLGLTCNMGILFSWALVANELPLAAWVQYSGAWWYVFGYTLYACQDAKDDAKAGIKIDCITLRPAHEIPSGIIRCWRHPRIHGRRDSRRPILRVLYHQRRGFCGPSSVATEWCGFGECGELQTSI
ncbi:hypothetical protein BDZ89DRAFT_1181613, partial [Hymenopellis radicata]